ncbi:MAG: 50S ribosomal protein L29 [Candidatus Sungbacteria bacterium]|nr:50S ribosomal protein L29 [Candidatus Sungbacteria bacterium]
MKFAELKQKSKDELNATLAEDRTRIDDLRFALSQGKQKNVKEIAGIKKDIARIMTLLKND